MDGKIEAIFVTGQGGDAMKQADTVEAVAGLGIAGDRYLKRTGYWTGIDECQVTFIEGESLERIHRDTGLRVLQGEHRRNFVTRGIRLSELKDRTFEVGQATFEYDRPRPPCAYIQSITEEGMTQALARAGGGICARVVQSGAVKKGDEIRIRPNR